MTTIVCDSLITTLTQEVNLKLNRNYLIEGIKIRLVMFNAPSGTFTLSFKDGATTLASKDFTSADIKSDLSTTNNYAYIDKVIQFDTVLNVKGARSYDLVLSSTGYTEDSGSFLAWAKSYENIFNALESTPSDYLENPMDYLIYERVREDLVR